MLRILILLLLYFPASSQTVYHTPSGIRYHVATCKSVKNVSHAVSLSEAVDLGLTPCLICKPAILKGQQFAPLKKANGEGNTVQCKGTTKAGNRCKHMTGIGNGYCHQHQPG